MSAIKFMAKPTRRVPFYPQFDLPHKMGKGLAMLCEDVELIPNPTAPKKKAQERARRKAAKKAQRRNRCNK